MLPEWAHWDGPVCYNGNSNTPHTFPEGVHDFPTAFAQCEEPSLMTVLGQQPGRAPRKMAGQVPEAFRIFFFLMAASCRQKSRKCLLCWIGVLSSLSAFLQCSLCMVISIPGWFSVICSLEGYQGEEALVGSYPGCWPSWATLEQCRSPERAGGIEESLSVADGNHTLKHKRWDTRWVLGDSHRVREPSWVL